MTNYSPARLDGVPLGEIPQNQLYRLGRNIINGQGPDAPFLREGDWVVRLDPEILPPEWAKVIRDLRERIAGLELVTIPFRPDPLPLLPHSLTICVASPSPGRHAHLKGFDDFKDIRPDIHPDLPTPVDARMVRPQFRPVEKLPPRVPMVMGSTFKIIQDRHGTRLVGGIPSEQFCRDAASLGMTHDLFLWKGEPVWMSPGHYGGHETFTLHRMGLPRRTLTVWAGTLLDVAVTHETSRAPRADVC